MRKKYKITWAKLDEIDGELSAYNKCLNDGTLFKTDILIAKHLLDKLLIFNESVLFKLYLDEEIQYNTKRAYHVTVKDLEIISKRIKKTLEKY